MLTFTTSQKKIMKLGTLFIAILLLVNSCSKPVKEVFDAQDIVSKSILNSGGNKINNSTLKFEFRDKTYKAFRRFGNYQLERSFIDEKDTIIDILDNNKFERFVNFETLELADSTRNKYSNAVNSVHYFSVLPYGLNANAVNKKYLDTIRIKGVKYHKIEITFNKENGGDDFDDVFIYWINSKTYKVDYLAYEYHVNEGGKRFREAYNERIIDSIRFVDYNNYKPINKKAPLSSLDQLFEKNELKLLSKIELKAIEVK